MASGLALAVMNRTQRLSFSRGLAEREVVDRDDGTHTPAYQNRRGKAVGLEAIVGPTLNRLQLRQDRFK